MLAITINRVYWSLKASVLTQDVSWPTWMEPTHTQFSSLPNLTSNQLFTWNFVLNSQHALTVLNRMCAPSQVLVSTFSLFCRFWPLLPLNNLLLTSSPEHAFTSTVWQALGPQIITSVKFMLNFVARPRAMVWAQFSRSNKSSFKSLPGGQKRTLIH